MGVGDVWASRISERRSTIRSRNASPRRSRVTTVASVAGMNRRRSSARPVSGDDELVNVPVEGGAGRLGLEPRATKQLEKVGGLHQVGLP
jgi:hypothetical protein